MQQASALPRLGFGFDCHATMPGPGFVCQSHRRYAFAKGLVWWIRAGSPWYWTGWKPVPQGKACPTGQSLSHTPAVGRTSSPSRSLAFQADIPPLKRCSAVRRSLTPHSGEVGDLRRARR